MCKLLNGRLAEELLVDFKLFEHIIRQIVHNAVNDVLPSISLTNERHIKEAAYDYGLHRKHHDLW